MNAIRERNYFNYLDKSFKATLFLEKHPSIKSIIIKILFFILNNIRKIYSRKTNSSRVIVIIDILRLGDTVFSMPAIMEIYNYYKNYKIFIICYNETKDILSVKFNNDDIIPIDKWDFWFKRKIAKNSVRRKIASLNPQVIFDFTGQITSASMIFNSRAEAIIGTNLIYFKGIYDKFTEYRQEPKFIDIYFDVIRLTIPFISKSNNNFIFTNNFDRESKILIHPFAIRSSKEWGLRKFVQLAIKLKKKYRVELICPIGFITNSVKEEIINNGLSILETNSIKELINELKNCSLFICNDSGPIYIAALLGKATFTIYGPTNYKYSLIDGNTHKFIRRELTCTPIKDKACFTLEGIYCPSYECLESLSFDDVTNEILNFANELRLKKQEILDDKGF